MSEKPIKIAISAGEASGDFYGAKLAAALKSEMPGVELVGVGGAKMRESGVRLLKDSSHWGAISIVEALKIAPKVYAHFKSLQRVLLSEKPDLILAIDFGAFNVPLLKWAKARQFKTLYFMPPGSWRKNKQGADLPRIADFVATPFPWSAEILQTMGASVEWVGHPLLDFARPSVNKTQFFEELGLPPDRTLIGMLPGSRLHELQSNLPVMAQAATLLEERFPQSQLTFVAALSSNLNEQAVVKVWEQHHSKPLLTLKNRAYDVMAHSRALLVSSGTATLEAAIVGTPLVVLYRGSPLMNLEYKIRKPKFDFISLPNIFLERGLVPELIQEQANPESLCQALIPLIEETSHRCAQLQGFEQIRQSLGSPGAIQRVATHVKALLSS